MMLLLLPKHLDGLISSKILIQPFVELLPHALLKLLDAAVLILDPILPLLPQPEQSLVSRTLTQVMKRQYALSAKILMDHQSPTTTGR
jgi:hypothetical protein